MTLKMELKRITNNINGNPRYEVILHDLMGIKLNPLETCIRLGLRKNSKRCIMTTYLDKKQVSKLYNIPLLED